MRNYCNTTLLRSAALTAAIVLFVGCTTSSPTINTSPDAEVTYDGLHELKGTAADKAWVRPDIDLSQYSKIMLLSAGIEYRPGGESGRTTRSRSQGGPYEVTEAKRPNSKRSSKRRSCRNWQRANTLRSSANPDRTFCWFVGRCSMSCPTFRQNRSDAAIYI